MFLESDDEAAEDEATEDEAKIEAKDDAEIEAKDEANVEAEDYNLPNVAMYREGLWSSVEYPDFPSEKLQSFSQSFERGKLPHSFQAYVAYAWSIMDRADKKYNKRLPKPYIVSSILKENVDRRNAINMRIQPELSHLWDKYSEEFYWKPIDRALREVEVVTTNRHKFTVSITATPKKQDSALHAFHEAFKHVVLYVGDTGYSLVNVCNSLQVNAPFSVKTSRVRKEEHQDKDKVRFEFNVVIHLNPSAFPRIESVPIALRVHSFNEALSSPVMGWRSRWYPDRRDERPEQGCDLRQVELLRRPMPTATSKLWKTILKIDEGLPQTSLIPLDDGESMDDRLSNVIERLEPGTLDDAAFYIVSSACEIDGIGTVGFSKDSLELNLKTRPDNDQPLWLMNTSPTYGQTTVSLQEFEGLLSPNPIDWVEYININASLGSQTTSFVIPDMGWKALNGIRLDGNRFESTDTWKLDKKATYQIGWELPDDDASGRLRYIDGQWVVDGLKGTPKSIVHVRQVEVEVRVLLDTLTFTAVNVTLALFQYDTQLLLQEQTTNLQKVARTRVRVGEACTVKISSDQKCEVTLRVGKGDLWYEKPPWYAASEEGYNTLTPLAMCMLSFYKKLQKIVDSTGSGNARINDRLMQDVMTLYKARYSADGIDNKYVGYLKPLEDIVRDEKKIWVEDCCEEHRVRHVAAACRVRYRQY